MFLCVIPQDICTIQKIIADFFYRQTTVPCFGRIVNKMYVQRSLNVHIQTRFYLSWIHVRSEILKCSRSTFDECPVYLTVCPRSLDPSYIVTYYEMGQDLLNLLYLDSKSGSRNVFDQWKVCQLLVGAREQSDPYAEEGNN